MRFFFFLISTPFWGSCLSLDEKQIIKDSKEAFVRETYHSEVLQSIEPLNQLKDFLMSNADTIVFFKKEGHYFRYDTVQRRNRRYHIRLGEVGIPDNSDSLMLADIPKFLQDSLKLLQRSLNKAVFGEIKIWGDGSDVQEPPSMICWLKYREAPSVSNYYLYEYISFNKHEPVSLKLESIYGELQKDTTLLGGLKYVIRILPYSGW